MAEVISDRFTGWDAYTGAANPSWCAACAWAHHDPDLRLHPYVMTSSVGYRATAADLTETLTEPLGTHTAVVVPIARQKHLVPSAVFGSVTTDDLTIGWGPHEAARFATLRHLRSLGFNESALTEAVPRWNVLSTLSPATQVETLRLWPDLDQWRDTPPVLALAARASRPAKAAA